MTHPPRSQQTPAEPRDDLSSQTPLSQRSRSAGDLLDSGPNGQRVARWAALGDSRPVKLLLAVLVLASLLPPLEERLRGLLLCVFGFEFLLRSAYLRHQRRHQEGDRRPRPSDYLFLLAGALVVLSFLPLSRWLGPNHSGLVITAHLIRLLILLRLVRELARDVYLILTRREQLQQFALVTSFVAFLSLVTAVVLVQLGVAHNYDGKDPQAPELANTLWWAFRQLESADNLVPHLNNHKLIVFISLLLTITGVFVISFLIGIGSNVVAQVLRAERRRPIEYSGHTLLVGPVAGSGALVREFVTLYDKNRQLRRIRPREVFDWLFQGGPRPRRHALPRMVLLGPSDDPPDYLYDEMMRWVVYRQGDGADPEALRRAGAKDAKRVLLLSPPAGEPDADAITVAALAAVRDQNEKGHIFVELQDTQSCDLVRRVGGEGAFPLDVPRFAGLFLCQHLVVPGVELLYHELLEEAGSEFYSHVFVDPREVRALTRRARGPTISFAELSRRAHDQHHVVLAGVYLSQERDLKRPGNLVPINKLTQWINPCVVEPGSAAAALGAQPGQIPTAHLRGLVGVCESYRPLRRLGRVVCFGDEEAGAEAEPTAKGVYESGVDLSASLSGSKAGGASPRRQALRERLSQCLPDTGGLKRVLLIGFSPSLPALLRELSDFLGDPEVLLVIGNRGDERPPLPQRLAQLGLELDPLADEDRPLPGLAGLRLPLPRGGHATVWTHKGQHLADFAVRCLAREPPVDAVVFLSEPDAADRDARTGMRVLRFADALEAGRVPRGPRLHILAEFLSRSKGERVQALLRRCNDQRLRVTLVSTDQIKSYFLVRSAFVPGVTALFEELLSREGQAMVRLQPPPELLTHEGPLRFADVREALLPQGTVPLALELAKDDGTTALRLNPGPRERISVSRLRGIYAIASLGERHTSQVGGADQGPKVPDWMQAGGGVES